MDKAVLFQNRSEIDKMTDVNYEGAPTYKRGDREQLINVLTTGCFENTFYAGAKDLADEAVALITKVRDTDPAFLTKAIVYARNDGYMRIVPITALVILSAGDAICKRMTWLAFNKVIKTPGDLMDFVSLCRTGHFRGMGRMTKQLCGEWLQCYMTEYWAIKYGSGNQKYSMRDIYRTVRPKMMGVQNDIARYIVKKELAEGLPLLSAFEEFKQTKNPHIISLGLPYEVVANLSPTKEAWAELAKNAPYMNMLRNLNNYEKYGVLDDDAMRKEIIGKLTSEDAVLKSKQFPFRFYSALKAYKGNHNDVREALYDALELSFKNMPDLPGTTIIAVDESGSMSIPVSSRGSVQAYQVGNIFASAMYKKSENAHIIPFDTKAWVEKCSKKDSMLSIADKLWKCGGGTDLSSPIKLATQKGIKADTIVMITDSESWSDKFRGHYSGDTGSCALDAIKEYRRKINPNVKVFLIQLLPYSDAEVVNGKDNMYEVYGWSDRVIDFIVSKTGNEDIVDKVNSVVL